MKKGTITTKELHELMKALDRMKEWQFLITFRKVWPYMTIERANIITIGENTMGKTIDDIVKKELKK